MLLMMKKDDQTSQINKDFKIQISQDSGTQLHENFDLRQTHPGSLDCQQQ